MRARWIAALVLLVFVAAAACDGQGDADPTVEPPSPTPTPTADVDGPTSTPSATPEPGGVTLEGVFETGFEHSGFYEDALCPDDRESSWLAWTSDSMFAERLEDETGVAPFSAPDTLVFRVTITGEVSPPGEYGHLGQYPREVTVFELIDAELAGDCGDDGGPPGSSEPLVVTASDAGGDEVQLGLGSYCWHGGAGQPGLCADMIGHITNVEPLAVAAGETVFLSSQLVLANAEIQLHAWSVEDDEPIERGPDWLAWRSSDRSERLPLTVGDVGIAFEADLAPGLYVVSAFVVVPQGDVSYGLLLRIDGAAPVDMISLGTPLTLNVGWTVGIEGSAETLTFAGVVSDSRCPADVTCVWAGEALLAFELAQVDTTIARSMTLSPGSSASGVLGRYRLTVSELSPEPKSTTTIPPGSYEATLAVERLPALPSGSGVEGVVTLGPLCPVAQAGMPCPDRAYMATLALLDGNGVEVDRVTSGTDGYFRLAVAAGRYTLVPQSPPGLPLPFAGPIAIEVTAGTWTTVDVGYDSGIR